jgi:hypothetical protein
MTLLRQLLKQLDPHTFQELCFDVLKEKHPRLGLRQIDGKAGDEGLDIFEGELSGRLTIWQCKSFADGVGKSQKGQIRKSLKTDLEHFSPSTWILCLSVDLDVRTARWFERWQKSHQHRVQIGLWSASDILHELIHRRSLRNQYFPNAALDPIELKRLITRTGELSLDDIGRLTDNNLEDYVERLKERDARFNYQIIFDGEIGPPSPRQTPLPGLVMSFSNGAKTVNVFARDTDALTANPPAFTIKVKGTGIAKVLESQKTGVGQVFTSDEVGPITSDWPLLASLVQSGPPAKLVLEPSPKLTSRKRSVRVTFRRADAPSIEYAFMELSPTRLGTQEAELICTSEKLLFDMLLTVPMPLDLNGPLKITFRHRAFVGESVKQVKKFLDAMALLRPSGEVEIFDLKDERVFARAAAVEVGTENDAERSFHQAVTELAKIADRFRVELPLPRGLTDEDSESIVLLNAYISEGTLPVENISAVLLKSEENRELIPQVFTSAGGRLKIVHPRHEPMPRLFGRTIDTGPCAIEAEVRVNGLEKTLKEFQEAEIGQGVKVSFHAMSPARFSLPSEEGLT